MKIDVLDQKGKKTTQIELDKNIFGIKVNPKVISQYLYMYLSNQRQSNAHTKDRSEVRGGGKKPYKQKGTGRARFGSSRNPIWTGGGVSMGPTNLANYKKSINKKFKKAVLKNVLSYKVSNNELKVINEYKIQEDKPLTKQTVELLEKIANESKKALLVIQEYNSKIIDSFNNLKNAKVVNIKELNSYDIYNGGTVIFEEEALKYITENLKK